MKYGVCRDILYNMASKQSERRRLYRTYREAGIPFVQAHRLAKLMVREYALWADIERILGAGEVIQYCECCGPEGVRFRLGQRVVEFGYFSRRVEGHWMEEAK